MESIVIPNLNANENKQIEKNFDQKAKEFILNAISPFSSIGTAPRSKSSMLLRCGIKNFFPK